MHAAVYTTTSVAFYHSYNYINVKFIPSVAGRGLGGTALLNSIEQYLRVIT